MIQEINNNQIQGAGEKLLSNTSNQGKSIPENDADLSLQINYTSLINLAAQTEDNNSVEQARQLLLSGRIETLENIREAAENIIKLGI